MRAGVLTQRSEVGIDDLMVREDGIVQQLKSVYRIPASVMLVLDTGGEQNLSKDVRLTRAVAIALVSGLRKDDQIAVMQVNNRVELVQHWTTAQEEVIRALNHKLLPGKRSALAAGLVGAVEQFERIPSGNSHLVLVSDGVERGGIQPDLDEAVKALIAANITLHVISYTSLGLKEPKPSPTRPRVKSAVAKELITAMPHTRFKKDPTPDLRTMMETKGGMVLDVDRLFRRNGIRSALAQREDEFEILTEETGGSLWLPATSADMIRQGTEVAQTVDSQYVVSYKPLRPMNSAKPNEYRRTDVISRRVGLKVNARRGYVAGVPH